MGYRGKWNATDQIPRRAVEDGRLGRFDTGRQRRREIQSVQPLGRHRDEAGQGTLTANAYVIRSRLKLFSNFTYFLDDPERGDQFEQAERRTT